jgi:hypothetical protein
LLDHRGAEPEMLSGRTDDGDIDRSGVKMDTLVDPS